MNLLSAQEHVNCPSPNTTATPFRHATTSVHEKLINVTSTFGWLDTDRSQRQQMLELVDQFREQGTVDDLGIGQVRDAFSDLLFPGTSTLHTRLRYALFIPWLLQRASRERTASAMAEEMRRLEFRLIDSLKRGDAGEGILGSSAGRELKRLPSSVYWAMLGTWGIRTRDYSPGEFFANAARLRDLWTSNPASDDPESRTLSIDPGIDPRLPGAPEDLLKQVDFTLRPEEADYLTHRLTAAAPGSVLSWLVHNPPPQIAILEYAAVWELPHLANASDENRRLIDHAQRFAQLVHGARLTYNLLLARASSRKELIDHYAHEIADWSLETHALGTMRDWVRAEFWGTVTAQTRVSAPTRTFINTWLDHIAHGHNPVSDRRIHDLVETREKRLKGGRARLANRSALDRWSGAVGLNRLTYRWPNVRTLLDDLYRGRES